jgi:hypothetical protein
MHQLPPVVQTQIYFVIGAQLPGWKGASEDVFFQQLFSMVRPETAPGHCDLDLDAALRSIPFDCSAENAQKAIDYTGEVAKLFNSRNIDSGTMEEEGSRQLAQVRRIRRHKYPNMHKTHAKTLQRVQRHHLALGAFELVAMSLLEFCACFGICVCGFALPGLPEKSFPWPSRYPRVYSRHLVIIIIITGLER